MRQFKSNSSIAGVVVSALLFINPVSAAIPSGYYDSVNTTNYQTLHDSLHEIIDDHQRFPYTSSATDTWDILEQADEDPDNSSKIIDIYKNATYSKAGGGNSYYNREHSWPKSYGFPKDGSSNYPYTDAHHLFLSDSSYNSSRSNKPFADCNSGCSTKTTLANHGRGGGAGDSNTTTGSGATGSWETWDDRKGDSARALMYLAVRYEGGTHSITNKTEPDLILTDNRSLIANSNTGSNLSVAYMGLRSTLIQWHKDDPVDDFERRHNDAVYAHQGNRNPFIDHPEYVACVFEQDCSGLGGGSGGGGGSSPEVWINELHYDNSGSDQGEFVEVAGTANTNLSGWKILAYNGNGGSVYKTTNLSGTISNQQNGFGTKSFSISGLQNGAPDGIALIDDSNNVVQFLSYEGTFTASDGAASGMTSTNIGVSENSSTSVGHSLQLSGSGQSYASFTWQSAANDTPGSLNNGQSF
ncbi:endonuclease [Aliiglaciecola litoralis]|uniref:Endonuclease I n=1 Tax=Aliiglaciecola litoralis TaxID=582857 RepID=A0ABP3X152_9ALTE